MVLVIRVILFLAFVIGGCERLSAISFNVSFEPSTVTAPPGFFTAFNDAMSFYESTFDDPITINMHVGWGEIAGEV